MVVTGSCWKVGSAVVIYHALEAIAMPSSFAWMQINISRWGRTLWVFSLCECEEHHTSCLSSCKDADKNIIYDNHISFTPRSQNFRSLAGGHRPMANLVRRLCCLRQRLFHRIVKVLLSWTTHCDMIEISCIKTGTLFPFHMWLHCRYRQESLVRTMSEHIKYMIWGGCLWWCRHQRSETGSQHEFLSLLAAWLLNDAPWTLITAC